MTRFSLPRALPRPAPKPAIEPIAVPLTTDAGFDEDGRRLLTAPIAAPARAVPTIMSCPPSRLPRPPAKPSSAGAFVAACRAAEALQKKTPIEPDRRPPPAYATAPRTQFRPPVRPAARPFGPDDVPFDL